MAASMLGVLCAPNAWLTIAGLVTVAALASMIVLGVKLGPPGPMQFMLVAGVSGHLAASGSMAGSPLGPFVIPALVGVGALSAYALVIAPYAIPLMRRSDLDAVGCAWAAPYRLDEATATIARSRSARAHKRYGEE